VSSAEVGAAKPSAEIFAAALAAAGVVAGAALFVDDAAANVAGAAALGIPGHLYRGAAALADRLRACGFLGGP
jgi:HAD superfamily hydrolase (TIGR01509 family)